MAGRKSLSWHPVVEDFITIAKRLGELGFITIKQYRYCRARADYINNIQLQLLAVLNAHVY
jgi:hypothetical protein